MARFDFDPKRYPTDPGCYLMKNGSDRVIYVGKAKNLRKRISSYFHRGKKRRYIRHMISRIRDIEVIIVNSETESLILETNLIKQYRPDTNRAKMRDSSGYPYIVLTNEVLPRVVPYRKNWVNRELGVEGNEVAGRRFGPYISTRFRDTLLEFLVQHFKLRTCDPMPRSVCLSYHLERCSGICEQKISANDYGRAVEEAVLFLSRSQSSLIRQMREQMDEYAENLLFEKARKVRDWLAVFERALENQIVERDVDYDQDVIYFGAEQAAIMGIHQGVVRTLHMEPIVPAAFSFSGNEDERLWDVLGPNRKALCDRAAFLINRYANQAPAELIVNCGPDLLRLKQPLSRLNGRSVRIVSPMRGVKAKLLHLCQRNYEYRASLSG